MGSDLVRLAMIASLMHACDPEYDLGPKTHAHDTGSGDTSLDDTGELETLLRPPPWMWQARYLTVPRERGLRWELDESFVLENWTVPHIYVAPDGTFVMMGNYMISEENLQARHYLTSSDGLSWTRVGEMFRPESFSNDCGWRIEDSSMWIQDPETYRFVVQATDIDYDIGITNWLRFCQAVSVDGAAPIAQDGYFFLPEEDRVENSVPAFLSRVDSVGLFFYNRDLRGTLGDPGIRIAQADPASGEATPYLSEALLSRRHVDPMPVYIEGGGARLYHTYGNEGSTTTGIGSSELNLDATEAFDTTLHLTSPGECDKSSVGECYHDPAFLALDDGTLVIYFTAVDWSKGFLPTIKRAFAVD